MHLSPYSMPASPRYPQRQSGWLVEHDGSELNVYLVPEQRPDGSIIFSLHKGIGVPEHDDLITTFTIDQSDVTDEEDDDDD